MRVLSPKFRRILRELDANGHFWFLLARRELENERGERVADNLLREQLVGDAKDYYKYAEKISQVTLEDIRKVADIKDYGFAALVPETAKRARKVDKEEVKEEKKEEKTIISPSIEQK